MPAKDVIAQAIVESLISPNVSDSNLEAANLVDVGDEISRALWKLARTEDAQGQPGTLMAHGEAIKEAAHTIAEALDNLANAIRERQ
jgi:hypothetical protein